MSVYQRYHTVTTAAQELFHPDCPVFVSRYRLLTDIETGDRLLQVRLVNLSEKTVRAVFVCVRCIDAAEQPLATLELVPVTGQSAAPGQCFGEERLLTLWPKRTVYAEILPQRVEFADGAAWNLEGTLDFFAIAPAKPVRREDPLYPRLADAALRKGVRNDFYFAVQRGMWRCTCGTPNSPRALRCASCGAERSWLEQNMDPAVLNAPPKKDASDPAFELPKLLPTPIAVRPIAPEPLIPEELLRPHSDVPAAVSKPAVPEAPRKRSWVAWTLAAVFTLMAAAVIVGSWLLVPYLHYLQGVEAQNAGDYERALAIFSEIEDERDSAKRILEVQKAQALEMMQGGDYASALEQLKKLPGAEELVADCLYSMGVLACNDGDPAKGLVYARQLEEDFPDYENLPQLKDNCTYRLACSYMDEALTLGGAESYDAAIELLDSAKELFSGVPTFRDSENLILECTYRIAGLTLSRGEYDEAWNLFDEIRDYKDSADMVKECSYRIAAQNLVDGELDAARVLFDSLGDYSDSHEQVRECEYQMAKQAEALGLVTDAIAQYGALGDYRDSTELRDRLMLEFVREHYFDETADAALMYDYMNELLERNVSGAQELVDDLMKQSILLSVNPFADGAQSGSVVTVSSLDRLYVHYRMRFRKPDDPTRILVKYELPDGSSGTAPLNPDGSAEGDVPWSKLVPKACEQGGSVRLSFSFADADGAPAPEQIVFSYDPALGKPGENGKVIIPDGMETFGDSEGVVVYKIG